MLTTEQLKSRLDEIIKQRDDFIAQANQTVAAYNGRIAMLEELLATDSGEEAGDE